MPANISPLAQTFKVSEAFPQGCAITSVDLFFAIKDDVNPVEVQIVQVRNGYPTDDVLGDAKSVVYPSDIIANPSGLTPTKFRFSRLIQLFPNTEYAIKVITNSLKVKVWTAVMGETRIDNPSVLITQQPALGSLFKSQNNSTWTPEQTQDLTFVLNRAKFNTSVIGSVNLVESPVSEYIVLPANPFKITYLSPKVKVYHPNHGLVTGMLVRFIDSVDTQFNDINFPVTKVVNSDFYIITLPLNQNATDFVGGGQVKSEKVVKFDTIRVFGPIEGRDTGIKITTRLSSSTGIDSIDTDITPTEYTDLTTNKFIHSSINRNAKLAGASSFTLKTELSSSNDAMSPFVSMDRIVVQLIGNKINSPLVANDVDYDIDGEIIAVGSSNLSFTAATNKITVPVITDYTKIKLGAWIKVVSGSTMNLNKTGYISEIDTTANTLKIVGDALVDEASTSATINQYTSFISETANGGTAESKTITKQVNLDKECSGFRVIVQFNVHTDADLEMYYRTALKASAIKLSDSKWNKSLITYKKTANESEFTEYEYDIKDIEKFNEFQFKFVFLSTNTAVTPKIKKLRIISHA